MDNYNKIFLDKIWIIKFLLYLCTINLNKYNMIIQVKTTVTTEKEINFPYVTFYEYINYYYYNNAENSCIIITPNGVEIRSCNCGLEYPEVKPEEAFKQMDQTILIITEALNK